VLVKTAVLLCAIAAGFAPLIASAGLIYVNNMSDAAVMMTAYDASTPAKVVGTWCVETGAYAMHELKVESAKLQAEVMKRDECKEPRLFARSLPVPRLSAENAAALYRLIGTGGKYSLSGPFSHKAK
jgi:hypothetical protein